MEDLDLQIMHQLGNLTRIFYPIVNIESFIVCQRNPSQLFFVLLNHMKSFIIILTGHKNLQKFSFKLHYITLKEKEHHEFELQFSLPLQKEQFIYIHIESSWHFSLYNKSTSTGQHLIQLNIKEQWNDIISCTAFPIVLDLLMELLYQYIINQLRMESVITPERVIMDSI